MSFFTHPLWTIEIRECNPLLLEDKNQRYFLRKQSLIEDPDHNHFSHKVLTDEFFLNKKTFFLILNDEIIWYESYKLTQKWYFLMLNIYIKKQYQGYWLGSLLKKFLIDQIVSHHKKSNTPLSIRCTIITSNKPSIAINEKLWFRIIKHYQTERFGKMVNRIVMEKIIL